MPLITPEEKTANEVMKAIETIKEAIAKCGTDVSFDIVYDNTRKKFSYFEVYLHRPPIFDVVRGAEATPVKVKLYDETHLTSRTKYLEDVIFRSHRSERREQK